jgi:hypothetical protein
MNIEQEQTEFAEMNYVPKRPTKFSDKGLSVFDRLLAKAFGVTSC